MSIVEQFGLADLKLYANKNYIPVAKDDMLQLLFDYVVEHKPKNILEIGTAIGYSAIVMSKANASSAILTVELNVERYNMALQNFNKFAISNVTAINDDAKNLIEKLEIKNDKFDLIFLDGPKGQYINYLGNLLNILSDNGVIICDNINYKNLLNIKGVAPRKIRTIANNLKKFNETILNDKNLNVELLNVSDGVAKIYKKK